MEEQGMLNYVKKVIHSLVVSTPMRVSVESLKRDYLNEEGSAVPFIKLGFKNIESFLRSIPDTVTVSFQNENDLVSFSLYMYPLLSGDRMWPHSQVQGQYPEIDNKLQRGDIITKFNGESMEGCTFQVCYALFKGANGKISMEVTRPKPTLRTEAPK